MPDLIFTLASLYPMPFWFAMIVLPNWSWTQRLMSSMLIFVPLAIAYVVLVLLWLTQGSAVNLELASITTIDGVARLLGSPAVAAGGWVHYLTFDLFVGRWEYLDSRARSLNPILVAVALFFTLLTGPLGLLLYLIFRSTGKEARQSD